MSLMNTMNRCGQIKDIPMLPARVLVDEPSLETLTTCAAKDVRLVKMSMIERTGPETEDLHECCERRHRWYRPSLVG